MPVPLIARVVTGVGLAFASILLLAWWVSRPAAAASEPSGAATPRTASEAAEPPAPPAWPALLDTVRAPVWVIYLAETIEQLPARAAPVFGFGGAQNQDVRLIRSPPVVEDPRYPAWLAVGLVVPSTDLEQWSPAFRAAVITVLDALSVPRTVQPQQIVMLGGKGASRAAVERLCRWRRR